ncbi:MAG TPA: FTR1 family protein, partial [Steroidobacteraceae bacterium]|nr:FTR1 family protein [Steroidobacteraceae bacterium]
FAEAIASAMQGVGQEYFNATVLLLATAMLGWHHIWMKSHGRELARELSDTGARVTSGAASLSALLIVVAIAVMREGSEVVLFLYGIAIGGANGHEIFFGGVLGLIGGAILGALTYSGLARIPQRHLFSVTGWLLVLLAAGMASQAAGYLTQADVLPPLADPLWDSSSLLPEHSLLGQLFHVLIGYNEKPTGIQILFLATTLSIIVLLSRLVERRAQMQRIGTKSIAATIIATAALAGFFSSKPAQAADKIYTPIVEPGEYAIELRGHYERDGDQDVNGSQLYKFEFEHAPTSRWLTELVTEFEKEPGGTLKTTALEWENIFQLTEQGAHWVDFGVLTELERNLVDGEHYEVKFGALFEKSFGRQVVNFNLHAERVLVSDSQTELNYAARWRWRRSQSFEPAIEAYGELGDIDHLGSLGEKPHSVGPGLVGATRFRSGAKLRYEAAFLLGVSSAAPNSTLRLQLEYEFR